MSDELVLRLGKIIEGECDRDAVHVAVAPIEAAEQLFPSQRIGINSDGKASAAAAPIGIVDPFLPHAVRPGDRFFLWVQPGTITSLRHEWTHSAFREPTEVTSDKEESMRWMREYAAKHRYYPNYYTQGEEPVPYSAEQLIVHAQEFLKTGERHVQRGSESLRDEFYDSAQHDFWRHFATITGEHVGDKDNPFCCTC